MSKIVRILFKIFAITCPVLAALTIMPLVLELPPISIPPNLNAFQILVVIPFYVGLVAAPGYIFALFFADKKQNISLNKRLWIRWSLYAAIFASVGGLTTILAVIPFPFVLGSLVSSIIVLKGWNHR